MLRRNYSSQYFSGQEESASRNVAVEWLRNWSTLSVTYLLLLFVFYNSVKFFVEAQKASTVTNVTHALVTFLGLHWAKGSPDPVAQGEYNGLTVWEQIDDGEPWTISKKVFMIVPTLTLIYGLNAANYDKTYMAINLPVYALCIIPKLPLLHGVRIFGINSTVGIDDPVVAKATATSSMMPSRSSSSAASSNGLLLQPQTSASLQKSPRHVE